MLQNLSGISTCGNPSSCLPDAELCYLQITLLLLVAVAAVVAVVAVVVFNHFIHPKNYNVEVERLQFSILKVPIIKQCIFRVNVVVLLLSA